MVQVGAVVPLAVSVQLAHAAVQVLAADQGLDVLHIKGPAVDPRLLPTRDVVDPLTQAIAPEPVRRSSVDADVLVRPGHVRRLVSLMERHGWTLKVPFEAGSSFEHAATFEHTYLGHLDLHRTFPGIRLSAETAFELLWRDRHEAEIGGIACPVPSIAAQRLLLIIHAARGVVSGSRDIQNAWDAASVAEQAEVAALARDLGAEVALAAGTGRLEEYRGSPEYPLWRDLSTGESSLARLWWDRVRAAPNLAAGLRIGAKLLLPRVGRLRVELGRDPTPTELLHFFGRHVRALGHAALAPLSRLLRGARR